MNFSIFKTIKQFRLSRLVGLAVNTRTFSHFLLVHLLSLLVVLLIDWGYAKLAALLVITLFNLNAFLHSKLRTDHGYQDSQDNHPTDSTEEPEDDGRTEWLQAIIDQLWCTELAAAFQRELNKFYINNRNTEYRFHHFYLSESRPPQLDEIRVPTESTRTDEIVLHFRVTLTGTAFIKLNEENDKAEAVPVSRLIQRYGFRRRSQTGTYQDAKLKKKNFLIKELHLNGRSRIVLRPLCNQAPFFTSLTFSLLERPAMYSNDQRDLAESSDEFEARFYGYLIERICLPFLAPNRLILLYAHRDYIKTKHSKLLRLKLSETNQFMRTKLRRLIRGKRKWSDFVRELSDHRIIDWYRTNVVQNLDLIELTLNYSTYQPAPLFIFRIQLIEVENAMPPSCVLFVRIRVGQLSVAKMRLVTTASPVLNLTALLPVHDHYELCSVQMFEIRSHDVTAIQQCTSQLATLFWNRRITELPKDNPLIRPISEASFSIDQQTFDGDALNGQDFWFPLEGPAEGQPGMAHLSCACFRLSAAPQTIRKVSRLTRSMMITKGELSRSQLPVAFIKLYAENFVCTCRKDHKLRSRRSQFNRLEFGFAAKTKTVDLLKLTKTRLIFRSGCHFFAYDDPFTLDLIVELASRRKEADDDETDKIRLLNLISLADYKDKPAYNEKLPIYIVNSKDFQKAYDKEKRTANFKLIDKEEYGQLALNLFISYVQLEAGILKKLFMAPEIRGQCLGGEQRPKKRSKLTKKDKNQLLGLAKKAKRRMSLRTGECVGRLYFKLVNANQLAVGVLAVQAAPYDQTKRVKLQVVIELWKGNQKMAVKKTPFTEIVHNPTFDSSFQFSIDSGNLQQYAVRFVVVQRSGLFRSALKIIADRFCTIPLLTPDASFVIRSYRLKTDKKVEKVKSNASSKNQFNFK